MYSSLHLNVMQISGVYRGMPGPYPGDISGVYPVYPGTYPGKRLKISTAPRPMNIVWSWAIVLKVVCSQNTFLTFELDGRLCDNHVVRHVTSRDVVQSGSRSRHGSGSVCRYSNV